VTGFRYSAGAAIEVEDIDGDGRADVVTGRYRVDDSGARQMLWFANTAGGWVEHVLSPTAFCHDMAFGDVDGDGRTDMICIDQFLDSITWLQAPADWTQPWTSHPIDSGYRPMGAALADIDGDGRLDVVSGRSWYLNGSDGTWTRHMLTTLTNDADPFFNDQSEVDVADIDGDGRLDVYATIFGDSLQGRLFALLQPPDIATTWTAVEIDPGPLWGVHSQAAADFDGSGRPQVMVGEAPAAGFGFGTNPSPQIYIYRLNGEPTDPAAWERTLVDTVGTLEADAVDIDGDGRLDIAGHAGVLDGSTPGVISWWQNTTPRAAGPTTTTTTLGPRSVGCDSATCFCGAAVLPACSMDGVPASVRVRAAHACLLVGRGGGGARRTRRTAHAIAAAGRRAGRAANRWGVASPCAQALAALHAEVVAGTAR